MMADALARRAIFLIGFITITALLFHLTTTIIYPVVGHNDVGLDPESESSVSSFAFDAVRWIGGPNKFRGVALGGQEVEAEQKQDEEKQVGNPPGHHDNVVVVEEDGSSPEARSEEDETEAMQDNVAKISVESGQEEQAQDEDEYTLPEIGKRSYRHKALKRHRVQLHARKRRTP